MLGMRSHPQTKVRKMVRKPKCEACLDNKSLQDDDATIIPIYLPAYLLTCLPTYLHHYFLMLLVIIIIIVVDINIIIILIAGIDVAGIDVTRKKESSPATHPLSNTERCPINSIPRLIWATIVLRLSV